MNKIICLTGPIAAGKDAVAKILAERGAYIIDVDEEAHELYPQVADQLKKEFGTTDRKKIGEIAFADLNRLKKLTNIIHPLLKTTITEELKNLRIPTFPGGKSGSRSRKARIGTKELLAINGAVLKEIGLIELCDEVWVVLADRKIRLARLIAKGFSQTQAEARINSQMSAEDYRSIADVVIENNGTLKDLQSQLASIRSNLL